MRSGRCSGRAMIAFTRSPRACRARSALTAPGALLLTMTTGRPVSRQARMPSCAPLVGSLRSTASISPARQTSSCRVPGGFVVRWTRSAERFFGFLCSVPLNLAVPFSLLGSHLFRQCGGDGRYQVMQSTAIREGTKNIVRAAVISEASPQFTSYVGAEHGNVDTTSGCRGLARRTARRNPA